MNEAQVVRLRGHHLLCMLTWAGTGYSPAFTAKFDDSINALKQGVPVEVVLGPDDMCQTLDPDTTPDYHCDLPRNFDRDAMSLAAISEHLGLELKIGSRFTVDEALLTRMRLHYKSGDIRPACTTCQWRDFCTDIAADDFACTRLKAGVA